MTPVRRAICSALIGLIVLTAGACSLTEVVLPTGGQETPPDSYKQRVVVAVTRLFDGIVLSNLEISDLRRDTHWPNASWSACLRDNFEGRYRFFTVFFRANEIVYSRTALKLDNCETAIFERLIVSPDAKASR